MSTGVLERAAPAQGVASSPGQTTARRNWHGAALLATLLIAVALRAWGLTWGLWNATVERRPQPDEWVVYWTTRWFGEYHALNPCPAPARSQCFFDWGAFFPYVSYLAHLILSSFIARMSFGAQAEPAFIQAVLAGRFASLLCSTLTVLASYWLGRLAYGRTIGLLAAFVVALTGLLIELAHFATPDSTTVLLCTTTLLLCMASVKTNRGALLIAAGALAGLAAGSEYHMALLGAPIVASWTMQRTRSIRVLGLSVGAAGIAFLAANPYIPLEFASFRGALLHALQIRTVDSALEYGTRFSRYGPPWLFVIHYVFGYGASAGVAVWMVLGVIWAAVRRQKGDLVALAWIVPYSLLVSLSTAKFIRYGAPLLPISAVLAARFAFDVWHTCRPQLRPLLAAGFSLALLYSAIYDAAYAGLFSSPEPRAVAIDWLSSHAPRGTDVGFEILPDGLINAPYFASPAGFHPCFSLFQPSRLNGPMQYLIVDSYVLEEHSHFSDAQVSRFYRALQTDPSYRVVKEINDVPTLLGLRFPLAGSPHDWRYVAHEITIYRHIGAPRSSASYCFANVDAANRALYSREKA